MAQAYPRASIVGSDYHDVSIEQARKAAVEAGVGDRVQFDVASAQTFAGSGYDLVTSFDCLHDMGDPLGAARHVRAALAPDGTWMVVEPAAGDRVEDNLNPVGRVYYGVDPALRADTRREVVSQWRKRFFRDRLAGLDERARPGRPRAFPPRSRPLRSRRSPASCRRRWACRCLG